MSVQIKNVDSPNIGVMLVNDTVFIGSTEFKNLFFQVSGEDLNANDSQWELQQSNNKSLDYVLVAGGAFTLSDITQNFDLSNISGLYLKLKLVNKGTVTDGILHFKGTLKG